MSYEELKAALTEKERMDAEEHQNQIQALETTIEKQRQELHQVTMKKAAEVDEVKIAARLEIDGAVNQRLVAEQQRDSLAQQVPVHERTEALLPVCNALSLSRCRSRDCKQKSRVYKMLCARCKVAQCLPMMSSWTSPLPQVSRWLRAFQWLRVFRWLRAFQMRPVFRWLRVFLLLQVRVVLAAGQFWLSELAYRYPHAPLPISSRAPACSRYS